MFDVFNVLFGTKKSDRAANMLKIEAVRKHAAKLTFSESQNPKLGLTACAKIVPRERYPIPSPNLFSGRDIAAYAKVATVLNENEIPSMTLTMVNIGTVLAKV